MSRRKKVDTREVGLEIGLLIGKHFFHTEHLHYGYWTSDLDIDLLNLPRAQEQYCDFLISHIPDGAKTVLDVGCGAGRLAWKLINLGYAVDCVSPSPVLTEHTRSLLGDRSHIFECRFEDLQTERRYDVVLFSESFQYISVDRALQTSLGLLNDGGHLLICDFFKTDAEGVSLVGGGHRLASFYERVSGYGLEPIRDIDITEETAPTIDVANDMLTRVGLPIWNLAIRSLSDRYRLLSKFLQWKYRERIQKISRKYLSGRRDAENFAKFKSYRLLLYRKVGV